MLSLMEKVVLISIDEEKNKISAYSYNFYRFGIKGALILKLAELKKISIKDKKLTVIDESFTGDEVLDMALKYINSKGQPIRISSWFYGHTSINRDIKNRVIEKLEDRGVLIQEKKRFLGLISYTRYNITNLEEKQKIKELMRSILLEDSRMTTHENIIIASLVAVCSCLKVFLDKSELKSIKEKVKQINKAEYFVLEGEDIKEVLKAIKNAIAAQYAAAGSAGA